MFDGESWQFLRSVGYLLRQPIIERWVLWARFLNALAYHQDIMYLLPYMQSMPHGILSSQKAWTHAYDAWASTVHQSNMNYSINGGTSEYPILKSSCDS